MFNSHRYQPLLFLKIKALINVPFQKISPFLPYSFNFCTKTASESNPFVVSYLIDNLEFSRQHALQVSKRFRFKSPQKPDLVIAFLKSHGFSLSQISSVFTKQPQLITCNPNRLLPKFEFLASKGASTSDIVKIVTKNPLFAKSSLENSIIPSYEIVRSFSQSDRDAIRCIVGCPYVFTGYRLPQNVKFLLDEGIVSSTIRFLLHTRGMLLLSSFELKKCVDELKKLGFDPSQVKFGIALVAKKTVSKSHWDAKVDAFKNRGWSAETISEAFRRQPLCMLASKDKINEVMRLWVDQFGWNPLALVKKPDIFGFSLERRIIPRAFVVQYLLRRGLMNKNHSLCTPFGITEKEFLRRYVERFTSERSQLLKIYQEKMNVQSQDNME